MIEIPENVKGLIFDCDGTLVDSMPLHMEAWKYAMKEFDSIFDYDFFFAPKGMPAEKIIDLYNKKYKSNLDPEKVVRVKHEYFSKHVMDVKPIEPVVDVVERFKYILPMAVASGSIKEFVYAQLKAVGILDRFKIILTSDDPIKPKPAPDIFLEAARRMKIKPEDCLVFEDGDPGLIAAASSRMRSIDVRKYFLVG